MVDSFCPQCGGPITYDPQSEAIQCPHCRKTTVLRAPGTIQGMRGTATQRMSIVYHDGAFRNGATGDPISPEFLNGKTILSASSGQDGALLVVEW